MTDVLPCLSSVARVAVPVPRFVGTRTVVVDGHSLDRLRPYMDFNTLYRHHWGYGRLSAPSEDGMTVPQVTEARQALYRRLFESELNPMFERLWREAKHRLTGWLNPVGVYGVFPVQANGNELVIYDPVAYVRGARGKDLPVRERISFPRQPNDGTPRNRDRLCITDYFVPVSSDAYDFAGFQVVTAGKAASDVAAECQRQGEYDRGLRIHGIAATVAEAMAGLVQDLVAAELGVAKGQGLRFSWGYLACPNLADQEQVLRLLPAATTTLGISLTSGYQFDPDQTTAAIYVHHPSAKYFAVLPSAKT